MGYLTDALASPAFLSLLLQWLQENARIPVSGGELIFTAEAVLRWRSTRVREIDSCAFEASALD